MGAENLVYKVAEEVIYDPLGIVSGVTKVIQVSNMGEEDLGNLGLYIKPATGLGELDYPPAYPPDTDYQDLLTWGENSHEELVASGGLFVTVNQNTGVFANYITRIAGSTLANKILIQDIAAGDTLEITVDLETPPATSARRLYVDMVVE